PTIVSPPAAARVLLSLIWGITTGCLSYAPKGKLPAGVCLIIIGTEGPPAAAAKASGRSRHDNPLARQMLGERLARGALAGEGHHRRGFGHGHLSGDLVLGSR